MIETEGQMSESMKINMAAEYIIFPLTFLSHHLKGQKARETCPHSWCTKLLDNVKRTHGYVSVFSAKGLISSQNALSQTSINRDL